MHNSASFSKKIESARSVRIETLFTGSTVKVGRLLRGFCPFHQDKTHPNFFIYPDTNSWCCFAGCGAGDSIAFYQKLKNISFRQAVEELSHD